MQKNCAATWGQRIRSPLLGTMVVCASLFCGVGWLAAEEEVPGATLIQVSGGSPKVEVRSLESPEQVVPDEADGIVIWSEDGRDQWKFVGDGSAAAGDGPSKTLSAISRGHSENVDSGPMLMTVAIDQLSSLAVVRGGGLVTPVDDGYCLHPKPTFRRGPESDNEEKALPERKFKLQQDGTTLGEIRFAAGTKKVGWSDIAGLSDALLQDGLPAGRYSVAPLDASYSATPMQFNVADVEERTWADQVIKDLSDLLGTKNHPLVLQVAAERYLYYGYLSDALDVLESSKPETLTAHLMQLRDSIRRGLLDGDKRPQIAVSDPTGIESVDTARRLILLGKWKDASAVLTMPDVGATSRGAALRTLYHAVILAESGPATDLSARTHFADALRQMEGGKASDQYLAENNFGTFLLNRAQDAAYSVSFQSASGVADPFTRAVNDWVKSRQHLQRALEIAEADEAINVAPVQINLARLHSLLADLIRVLDHPTEGKRRFGEGEAAALQTAQTLAEQAIEETDVATQPIGHELLAHIAYRRRDSDRFLKQSKLALDGYIATGLLAGAESVHRMLGLFHLRMDQFDPGKKIDKPTALKHLLISNQLSEILREQVLSERTGSTLAGFFGRRAYVNEHIIDLLVDSGKPAEALRFAEAAKARALTDLLRVHGAAPEESEAEPRPLAEILQDWPSDIIALEYYLGQKKVWGFAVDNSGRVTARVLLDHEGKPLNPQQVVHRVTRLITDMQNQAEKMRTRFDHSWQQPMHELYQQLMPEPVAEMLKEAKTVVIVPHNVLHYLPFAALVTRPDPEKRSTAEIPMAEFLIDRPFHLNLAPSLITWDMLRRKTGAGVERVNFFGIRDFHQPGVSPLPGAEQDRANIETIFGQRLSASVFGEQGEEANFKGLLQRPGMLFVATHGVNHGTMPLASHLKCHRGDDEDGMLTAYEIFNSHVAAELVVLSACYSGLAEQYVRPGDDLLGLQRAFLQSGALSVVSGLWDVYDYTGPMLMKRYFTHLQSGATAAEALAKAQREFLAEQRTEGAGNPYLHPFFWAVYSIAGSDLTRMNAVP